MKKALALLLALALPAVARASVLVIDYSTHSAYTGGNSANQQYANMTSNVVLGMLRRQPPSVGIAPKILVIPYTATKTLWARQGQYFLPNGTLLQFDAVIHMNWLNGMSATGFNPDSMWKLANYNNTALQKWPTVPQVWVGPCATAFNKHTQSDPCSTGVTNNVGSQSNSYSVYNTEGTESYRQENNMLMVASVASRPPGIYRVLLAYSAGPGSTGNPCTDCNAITRASSSAAESLIAIARYPSATIVNCPNILVNLGQNTAQLDAVALKKCLAVADSAAGRGEVIGRQPLDMAFVLAYYFATGNKDREVTAGGGAPFIPATGTVDSLNQKAMAESLGALRYNGAPLPITIPVQTDSAQALAYQRSILRLIRGAKLTPMDYAGIQHNFTSTWSNSQYTRSAGSTGADAPGNTSRYYVTDIWGETRARTWKPATGWVCTDGDTGCAPCLLKWSLDRADSIARNLGLAGVDRAFIWAPNMDWTPSTVTKTNASTLDSVLYAAYAVGVRNFLTCPDVLEANPNVYTGAQPLGWGHQAARLPVKRDITTGPIIGYINLVATRGGGAKPGDAYLTTHDYIKEHVAGWLIGGPWFSGHATLNPPGPLYYHDFYGPTNVMAVSAMSLGGTGDGTTPKAYSYFFIKEMLGVVTMINASLPPGQPALRIVYAGDLKP